MLLLHLAQHTSELLWHPQDVNPENLWDHTHCLWWWPSSSSQKRAHELQFWIRLSSGVRILWARLNLQGYRHVPRKSRIKDARNTNGGDQIHEASWYIFQMSISEMELQPLAMDKELLSQRGCCKLPPHSWAHCRFRSNALKYFTESRMDAIPYELLHTCRE